MSYNKIVIYTENSYCEQERLYIYIFETDEVEKFCRTEAKGIKPQQST